MGDQHVAFQASSCWAVLFRDGGPCRWNGLLTAIAPFGDVPGGSPCSKCFRQWDQAPAWPAQPCIARICIIERRGLRAVSLMCPPAGPAAAPGATGRCPQARWVVGSRPKADRPVPALAEGRERLGPHRPARENWSPPCWTRPALVHECCSPEFRPLAQLGSPGRVGLDQVQGGLGPSHQRWCQGGGVTEGSTGLKQPFHRGVIPCEKSASAAESFPKGAADQSHRLSESMAKPAAFWTQHA